MNGSDYRGRTRLLQDRVRATEELVVVDGVRYVRVPGGDWQRDGEPAPAEVPGDPFAMGSPVDWAGLEYVGPVRREGRRMHHLRMPELDWEGLTETLIGEARAASACADSRPSSG